MFSHKFYPNPENFTPSKMVWMVTFCKSVIALIALVALVALVALIALIALIAPIALIA